MRYIHRTLLTEEKLTFWTKPHWIIFSTPTIAFILAAILLIYGSALGLSFQMFGKWQFNHVLSIACVIAGIITGINSFIFYQFSEYGITDKRVLMKTGWIQRDSLEIFLDKIEAVRVDQSILGRLLNYGGITIIGTGGTQDRFLSIPHPLDFRQKVQQQIALVLKEYGTSSST